MALELQTTLPTANVPLFPNIQLRTSVVAGKLVVSVYIETAYGRVENYGMEDETWAQVAPGGSFYINDILNPPEEPIDLTALAPSVAQAWPVIVGLCQSINVMVGLV